MEGYQWCRDRRSLSHRPVSFEKCRAQWTTLELFDFFSSRKTFCKNRTHRLPSGENGTGSPHIRVCTPDKKNFVTHITTLCTSNYGNTAIWYRGPRYFFALNVIELPKYFVTWSVGLLPGEVYRHIPYAVPSAKINLKKWKQQKWKQLWQFWSTVHYYWQVP